MKINYLGFKNGKVEEKGEMDFKADEYESIKLNDIEYEKHKKERNERVYKKFEKAREER